MKANDIALIGVVVFVSIIVSVFVSKLLFASPKNRQQQVQVVAPISADFPDTGSEFTKYFNSNAIDPTQVITIGNSSNSNPFNGSTNQ